MSNKTNDHQGHDDEAAEPLIKTPQQLIKVILLAFIVPVIVIVLLAGYVTSGKKPNAGSDVMSTQSIEARIRPVARFEINHRLPIERKAEA